MRCLAAAVLLLAAVPAAAARAQSGDLIGTFRFHGCDALLCDDLTVWTYNSASDDWPYEVRLSGTITATPAFFAAGNTFVDGRHGVAPDPQFDADWADGTGVSLETPFGPDTPAADYGLPALRSFTAVFTAAGLLYAAQADPSGADWGQRVLELAPVPDVVTATPEPATLALLATGLVAAGWARRRRRAHS